MKNLRLLVLLIMTAMLGVHAANAKVNSTTPNETKPITSATKRIVIFGDSYSDNGNDFKLTDNQYPNPEVYFQGRFSNGPVWVEYFAKLLNINPDDSAQFIDLAYGGAKILAPTAITLHGTPDKQYIVPNLAEEISTYEKQYKTFKSTDIVVLFISTNDFFDISATNAQEFFKNLADQQVAQIQRLMQLGAKHLVVFNGRDVTLSPLAKIVASINTNSKDETTIADYLQKFRSLIQLYNHRLTTPLSRTKEVVFYDIFAFDNQMSQKHVKGSRKKTIYNFNLTCVNNAHGDYQGAAESICNDPKTFFYYDKIHTTSTINQLLADSVYRNLPAELRTSKN